MKTDSIWYKLFLKFPGIFFELIGKPSTDSLRYKFGSVEVKELSFRLDGVFLPQEETPELPIHFLEVQFQKDEEFYSRLFTEIFIYLRQKKPKNDWQVTVVYARRSLETEEPIWYREFFNSPRLKRIYLDEELDWVKSPTVGIGAVQLIVSPETKAVESAKELIERTKQTVSDPASQEDLIKFIETIIIYKLPQKSREELEAMFGLSELKQTKVYQEALAEGEVKGKVEGKMEGKMEGKVEAVPRLLKLGLTVKQIAKALELPLEQVQQIAEEND